MQEKTVNFWSAVCCVMIAAVSETERFGNPTELALVDFAEAHHLNRKELQTDMPRIDEVSFDSKRKMMTTLHENQHGKISYTKGAATGDLQMYTYSDQPETDTAYDIHKGRS